MALAAGHDYLVCDAREVTQLRGRLVELEAALQAQRDNYVMEASRTTALAPGALAPERKPVSCHFVGTAFEELSLALHDAQSLADEASSHPAAADTSLDGLLKRLCDKIRLCVDRLDNIDSNLDEVDVRALLRSKSHPEASEGLHSSGIADFIEDQFTHHRRHSMGHALRQKSLSRGESISMRRLPTMTSVDSSTIATDLQNLGSPTILQSLSEGFDDWGLDLFKLEEETLSRSLETYSRFVLDPTGHEVFECDNEIMHEFIKQVAGSYTANAYHNSMHAAQVLHSGTWLTRRLLANYQSDLEMVAFAIAAICHDVKHFGRNNAFCINTMHAMAVRYNDSRVLESMHAATCFELMRSVAGVDMLTGLSRDDQASVRSQIIEYILATDMAEHFEMLGRFRVRLDSPEFDIMTPADRTLVAKMSIKAADIGHSSLPWDLHRRWSIRVAQEFYQQGDEERGLGLPVSALCDRAGAADLGKSQKGFLNFVCLPLFEALCTCEGLVAADSETEAAAENDAAPAETADSQIRSHCIVEIDANARRWLEDLEVVEEVKRVLLAP